jgi:hypothetical protein
MFPSLLTPWHDISSFETRLNGKIVGRLEKHMHVKYGGCRGTRTQRDCGSGIPRPGTTSLKYAHPYHASTAPS